MLPKRSHKRERPHQEQSSKTAFSSSSSDCSLQEPSRRRIRSCRSLQLTHPLRKNRSRMAHSAPGRGSRAPPTRPAYHQGRRPKFPPYIPKNVAAARSNRKDDVKKSTPGNNEPLGHHTTKDLSGNSSSSKSSISNHRKGGVLAGEFAARARRPISHINSGWVQKQRVGDDPFADDSSSSSSCSSSINYRTGETAPDEFKVPIRSTLRHKNPGLAMKQWVGDDPFAEDSSSSSSVRGVTRALIHQGSRPRPCLPGKAKGVRRDPHVQQSPQSMHSSIDQNNDAGNHRAKKQPNTKSPDRKPEAREEDPWKAWYSSEEEEVPLKTEEPLRGK